MAGIFATFKADSSQTAVGLFLSLAIIRPGQTK